MRGATYVTVSAQLSMFWEMLSFMVSLGLEVSGEGPNLPELQQVALPVLGTVIPLPHRCCAGMSNRSQQSDCQGSVKGLQPHY